jgi:hypothetical protein
METIKILKSLLIASLLAGSAAAAFEVSNVGLSLNPHRSGLSSAGTAADRGSLMFLLPPASNRLPVTAAGRNTRVVRLVP